MKHELFEELDAFRPKWQATYATLYAAARAAGVLNLYADYLKTKTGAQRARAFTEATGRCAPVETAAQQRNYGK
jgi:hypothetical protein